MIAAMYARRSVSKDPTKEVSREAQEAACRRMAGDAPLALYVDWTVSGDRTTSDSEPTSGPARLAPCTPTASAA
jgi:hypothetical protein